MRTLEQVTAAPVRTGEGGLRGWWTNTRVFFMEVRNETRRVTWLLGYTLVGEPPTPR